MSFLEFASAPNVWPFSVSLLLCFIITGLEIILGLIGIGTHHGADVDIDHPDLDVSLHDASFFAHGLDWLGLGKVPYLISVAGFLMLFGLCGMVVQHLCIANAGAPWPWWMVGLGSALVSLPVLRLINHSLGRIWPKEIESSAGSQDDLIGQPADITLGEIAAEHAGQIKVRDPHGTTHYVLAVADDESDRFTAGDPILVVGRRGRHYVVRRNPLPARSTD